jgi:N-methylhydantoinase A
MVVAGGAGPVHACMICRELEIPTFIVPRQSSIFCAAGMLMSDLQHDLVRSFVSAFDQTDWANVDALITEMTERGAALLAEENIPAKRRRFLLNLDCRYLKQYHEVSFRVDPDVVRRAEASTIAAAFHTEHKRMYGYSLEQEGAPIELINIRLRAIGLTEKPPYPEESYAGRDAAAALKGERIVYIPEDQAFQSVAVYDGHKTRHGNRIAGPALIEQVNTTVLLTSSYECLCDRYGSFVVVEKGDAQRLSSTLQETAP